MLTRHIHRDSNFKKLNGPGVSSNTTGAVEVVKSPVRVDSELGTGFSFLSWTYLHLFIRLPSSAESDICGDTNCNKTMADRQWLQQNYPHLEIRKRASPLQLHRIGTRIHESNDYILMNLQFSGKHIARGTPAVASFIHKVSVVNDLRANMLLAIDAIGPEQFNIVMSRSYVDIGSCGVQIPMEAKVRTRPVKAKVFTSKHTIIPPRSTAYLPVNHKLHQDKDQNLIFIPTSNQCDAFALLTDVHLNHVVIHNKKNKPIIIPRRAFMGHLCSINPQCQMNSIEDDDTASTTFHSYFNPPKSSPIQTNNFCTHSTTGANMFSKISPTDQDKLSRFLNENASIFQDNEFTDIPRDKWLKVQLKDN